MAATVQFPVRKITPTEQSEIQDMLAVEEPLEIRLAYGPEKARVEKAVSITMRTPGNDEELALGFLFTEGIIREKNAVRQVRLTDSVNGNIAIVEFQPHITPVLDTLDRHFYTSSSCGVCGKSSLDAIKTKSIFRLEPNGFTISGSILYTLSDLLRQNQGVFELTGGLHASAIFDANGNLIQVREDVGRHNALDKLLGYFLGENNLPLNNHILLLSGRVSFELMQKACMAGVTMVAAIGAPSSLAVRMAEEFDITLIGFLRDKRFTIYSGKQRIL